MLQISEFVWTLRSSVWIVFNNFLLIDATDRSKISSNQKHLFFAVRLYPLSFFASTPINKRIKTYFFPLSFFFQIALYNYTYRKATFYWKFPKSYLFHIFVWEYWERKFIVERAHFITPQLLKLFLNIFQESFLCL